MVSVIHVMVRTLHRDYSIMQVLIRRKNIPEPHNTLTQAGVGEACMDEYIFLCEHSICYPSLGLGVCRSLGGHIALDHLDGLLQLIPRVWSR